MIEAKLKVGDAVAFNGKMVGLCRKRHLMPHVASSVQGDGETEVCQIESEDGSRVFVPLSRASRLPAPVLPEGATYGSRHDASPLTPQERREAINYFKTCTLLGSESDLAEGIFGAVEHAINCVINERNERAAHPITKAETE